MADPHRCPGTAGRAGSPVSQATHVLRALVAFLLPRSGPPSAGPGVGRRRPPPRPKSSRDRLLLSAVGVDDAYSAVYNNTSIGSNKIYGSSVLTNDLYGYGEFMKAELTWRPRRRRP